MSSGSGYLLLGLDFVRLMLARKLPTDQFGGNWCTDCDNIETHCIALRRGGGWGLGARVETNLESSDTRREKTRGNRRI